MIVLLSLLLTADPNITTLDSCYFSPHLPGRSVYMNQYPDGSCGGYYFSSERMYADDVIFDEANLIGQISVGFVNGGRTTDIPATVNIAITRGHPAYQDYVARFENISIPLSHAVPPGQFAHDGGFIIIETDGIFLEAKQPYYIVLETPRVEGTDHIGPQWTINSEVNPQSPGSFLGYRPQSNTWLEFGSNFKMVMSLASPAGVLRPSIAPNTRVRVTSIGDEQ